MTLVTDALDRIARQVSLTPPTSWLSATDTEYVEIRDDFLLETVDDIQERLDLPSPIGRQQVIAGDGSASYSLTSDFKRLQRDQMAVYDGLLDRPCLPITTDGDWTYMDDVGITGVIRYYRITGFDGLHSITFNDEPATGTSITVSYVSTRWISDDGAETYKSAFTAATDVLLLPRRLIEAGTVWRWRERKGLPFQDKWAEYEALMARLSNDTRSRRLIDFGQTDKAARWQDMIPAYIPSS